MTLQEALSYPFDKLLPAHMSRTIITFLTEKEFDTLIEHLKWTNNSVKENDYDTITVGQTIFKKQGDK